MRKLFQEDALARVLRTQTYWIDHAGLPFLLFTFSHHFGLDKFFLEYVNDVGACSELTSDV